MEATMTFEEMKRQFPDEWVLVGNPEKDESGVLVLSGIPVCHHPDKRELEVISRSLRKNYPRLRVVYTGVFPKTRFMTGFFGRVKQS